MTSKATELAETSQHAKCGPNSKYQKVSERVQQWNRAIPEAGYITLGTIRYGVKLANSNLSNSVEHSINSMTSVAIPLNTSSSNSSAGSNNNCCCIGSTGIALPWSSNYGRTRLPVPKSTAAKNRTTSLSSASTVSSSESSPIGTTTTTTTQVVYTTARGAPLQQTSVETSAKASKSIVGATSLHEYDQREQSPPVCCYTTAKTSANLKKASKLKSTTTNNNNNNNNSTHHNNNNNSKSNQNTNYKCNADSANVGDAKRAVTIKQNRSDTKSASEEASNCDSDDSASFAPTPACNDGISSGSSSLKLREKINKFEANSRVPKSIHHSPLAVVRSTLLCTSGSDTQIHIYNQSKLAKYAANINRKASNKVTKFRVELDRLTADITESPKTDQPPIKSVEQVRCNSGGTSGGSSGRYKTDSIAESLNRRHDDAIKFSRYGHMRKTTIPVVSSGSGGGRSATSAVASAAASAGHVVIRQLTPKLTRKFTQLTESGNRARSEESLLLDADDDDVDDDATAYCSMETTKATPNVRQRIEPEKHGTSGNRNVVTDNFASRCVAGKQQQQSHQRRDALFLSSSLPTSPSSHIVCRNDASVVDVVSNDHGPIATHYNNPSDNDGNDLLLVSGSSVDDDGRCCEPDEDDFSFIDSSTADNISSNSDDLRLMRGDHEFATSSTPTAFGFSYYSGAKLSQSGSNCAATRPTDNSATVPIISSVVLKNNNLFNYSFGDSNNCEVRDCEKLVKSEKIDRLFENDEHFGDNLGNAHPKNRRNHLFEANNNSGDHYRNDRSSDSNKEAKAKRFSETNSRETIPTPPALDATTTTYTSNAATTTNCAQLQHNNLLQAATAASVELIAGKQLKELLAADLTDEEGCDVESKSIPVAFGYTSPPSPDQTASTLYCFGRSPIYARLSSPDSNIIMEKRRNTLDRLQRLRFGRRSASNPPEDKVDKSNGTKKSQPISFPNTVSSPTPIVSDKTERLKELTEMLKGSRTPPVPPPRRPRHSHSLEKTHDSPSNSSSLASFERIDEDGPAYTTTSPTTRSHAKSGSCEIVDLPEHNSTGNLCNSSTSLGSDKHLRGNSSIPNLEKLIASRDAHKSLPATAVAVAATAVSSEVDLFAALPRAESRTIVGSYTQKTIPFRSASFSQVDYASGKYIRSALGALKASLLGEKSASIVENTNLTLPRKKDGSRSTSPNLDKLDKILNENVLSEEDELLISKAKTINSVNNMIESMVVTMETNVPKEIVEETINVDATSKLNDRPTPELNIAQTAEMTLETLTEEELPTEPTEEFLQTATTCLIPVPVYECVVKDWSIPDAEQQWINACEDDSAKLIGECVSVNNLNNELEQLVEIEDNLKEAIAQIEKQLPTINVKNIEKNLDTETKPEFNESLNNSSSNENIGECDKNELNQSNYELDTNNCAPRDTLDLSSLEIDPIPSISVTPGSSSGSEEIREQSALSTEFVEVRKRHSNDGKADKALDGGQATSVSSCNTTGGQVEERRRIDKSKRRKGIYIQWPAIDKQKDDTENSTQDENSPPDNDVKIPWECDKLAAEALEKDVEIDLTKCVFSVKPNSGKAQQENAPNLWLACKTPYENISQPSSMSGMEPSTPDSEYSLRGPSWPQYSRRQSLTCQSSEEKDDQLVTSAITNKQYKNLLFLRSDSISDNESDRTPPRDRCSQSPAPGDSEMKRYSKRPLRGPYGQMLEAEMKKPNKHHYDEILEELSRSESPNKLSPPYRAKGMSAQSLDETCSPPVVKTPRSRKSSIHLPVPTHTRAASTPAHTDTTNSNDHFSHKRFPSFVETPTSCDSLKKEPKIVLSNSVSRDRSPKRSSSELGHTKRNSSNASDKSQKRSLDEKRLSSQVSRTPSDRSVTHNTPDTPRTGLQATPELLAELLKGSSEKIATDTHLSGASMLPTAVLKCLDTRTHIVVELFNTEKSYVDSLQTVVTKYMNPLKSTENANIADAQIVDEIFFMVPAILNVHERFLDEMKRRLDAWEPLQKVGDAFIEVFSKPTVLDTYTAFVNNWNRAKDAIRSTSSTRPAFARFLEAMAREHKGKLSLDTLLIKPVQKFPNYELILSRLIKHTDNDHPDQKPLQEALTLVHDILMHLNCKEREAIENGQREATLRELEGVIEGISDLVSPDRLFLLFDLVSMPSGQGARKERGFFLFTDLLVITSIKRRSGTIRKPNTTCPGSVASTLDTNKYKFLMKVSLDDLEIMKAKDENLRKIMKEIEQLSEDCSKLQQISELASSLRCQHQPLEEAVRDLQGDVQKQLSDRQTNDTQLSVLELTLNTQNLIQNMTVVFGKPEKRTIWEEKFIVAKQKLAASVDRHHVPEFFTSIPIRKTRAGLQFTCAAPTLGGQKDVWVCNSDGYVGQVCVMSLVPEPTVTSCNGVCNARILCVASVPALDEQTPSRCVSISIENPATRPSRNSLGNSHMIPSEKRHSTGTKSSNSSDPKNIQLDSSSSSEESENESHPENRAASPASVSQHNQDGNSSEESDTHQATMWLGTEDGCIHVYNCTDNIRIKKNKIKIQHVSSVYSILYLDNRVFVSLANGDVCVYLRDTNGWNTTSPLNISLGTVSSPVTRLLNVHGRLWCAIQGIIKVLNTATLQVENQIQISSDAKPVTNMTVSYNYVWISVQNSAHIKCFHSTSYELIFEVNLAPPVNKMLANCDDIIRQHKAACLRVTSLLACKDLIWVGTSAGVLLTIPAQNSAKGVITAPIVTGIPHGHTGHVRFLTFVEYEKPHEEVPNKKHSNRHSMHTKTKQEGLNMLVISGGDGYEDFRSSGANSLSDVAGREDSTNHLLLWQV